MTLQQFITLVICANVAVGYMWLGDWAIWKSGMTKTRGLCNLGPVILWWPVIIVGLLVFKMFTHRR